MQATSCDGCNEMAPADYFFFWPYQCGWIHIKGGPDHEREEYDACSWSCVATIVAARIAEGVDA